MIFGMRMSSLGLAAISVVAGLAVWQVLSLYFPPIFLPDEKMIELKYMTP